MAQQINLLNKGAALKKEFLDAGFIVKVMAVFLLGMAVYIWMLTQEVRDLAKQREDLTLHVQEAQTRMLQAASKTASPDASKSVQAEIAAAEEYVHAREQVLAALKGGAVGGGNGFAGMLKAFARQSVHGVWLTGISTNGTGDQMRISGRAVSPDLIAQYIGRLTGEQALHGRTFATFEVVQPKLEVAKGAALAKEQLPLPNVQAGYVEFILSAEKSTAGQGSELLATKAVVGALPEQSATPEQSLINLLEKSAAGKAPEQAGASVPEQNIPKSAVGVES
jgi:hypothetical protein